MDAQVFFLAPYYKIIEKQNLFKLIHPNMHKWKYVHSYAKMFLLAI